MQCEELQDNLRNFALAQNIELIVTSPMRRTLQTTEASLAWIIEKGVPVEVRGEWQGNLPF